MAEITNERFELQHDHLAVVPRTVGELLVVTIPDSPSTKSINTVAAEAVGQDAGTLALSILGQAGVIVSLTDYNRVTSELFHSGKEDTPSLERVELLTNVLGRHAFAQMALTEAHTEYIEHFTEEVVDANDVTVHRPIAERVKELREQTVQYADAPIFSFLKQLEGKNAIAAGDRIQAERYFRILYRRITEKEEFPGAA